MTVMPFASSAAATQVVPPADAPSARPEPAATASRHGAREMDLVEVQVFLRRQTWGVLSTLHDGRPYAVPVSFGYDGAYLYLASGPGRKLRSLESNPAVCLTVTDVVDGSRWTSVVAMGDAVPVHDLRGRLHGLNAIRRQQPGTLPQPKDLARAAGSTVFRVLPQELSGRTRR
jgi:nitroimidazol reductase NimA-like FMN-containing flavoprotein (pyridoxamine 5'-phosphate oxidase superfamily)